MVCLRNVWTPWHGRQFKKILLLTVSIIAIMNHKYRDTQYTHLFITSWNTSFFSSFCTASFFPFAHPSWSALWWIRINVHTHTHTPSHLTQCSVNRFHLLGCFSPVGGNRRTPRKPLQTQGEHMEAHTEINQLTVSPVLSRAHAVFKVSTWTRLERTTRFLINGHHVSSLIILFTVWEFCLNAFLSWNLKWEVVKS